MIILNTNVLSELMRPEPESRVVRWVDACTSHEVAICAITVAEILYGIERMPAGRRRRAFADQAAGMFEDEFVGRILAFDGDAAVHYALMLVAREKIGQPMHMADAQIAAICASHEASLATRNVKDFASLGIRVINPWQSEDHQIRGR